MKLECHRSIHSNGKVVVNYIQRGWVSHVLSVSLLE